MVYYKRQTVDTDTMHEISSTDTKPTTNTDHCLLSGIAQTANSFEFKSTVPRTGSGGLKQARFWIVTVPENDFNPHLPTGVAYLRGQLEQGQSGYRHWQLLVTFTQKKTLAQAKSTLGVGHWEPTRSVAAEQYVWKIDTRIGEPFEFGEKTPRRNSKCDWDRIRVLASTGKFDSIPSDVYIRYYQNLHRIRSDSVQPISVERSCYVYWGPTGTGKSHRAWSEAGEDAYSKDPRTKFWCGYDDQQHVVIDEFRGAIDVAHLLRFLDKYPVRVETKGSTRPLRATKFWITSNLNPLDWYPELDKETAEALMRRLNIEKITNKFIKN